MAAARGSSACYSLEYEIEPGDITDMLAGNPERSGRRESQLAVMIILSLAAVVASALAIRHLKSAAGAGDWVLIGVAGFWFGVIQQGQVLWQTSPRQIARRAFQKPWLQGNVREQVETGGIRSIAANGIETFFPWTFLVKVHETARAFHLLSQDGRPQVSLPKRALENPALIPKLREFLDHATGGQTAMADPDTRA